MSRCFCNPGGGEIALGITGTELDSCFRQPEHETHLTVDDFRLCIDGKSTGAVRVSLGAGFGRLARLMFAESLVLALCGGDYRLSGVARMHELGIGFKDLNTRQSSLEEIFVSLVKRSA